MNSLDFDKNNPESSLDFKEFIISFLKFFSYWKIFLASILLAIMFSYIFNRYSANIYTSTAKIKILDKEEGSFELPSAENLFKKNNINLENEIEVLKSQPILENVVKNLNLFYKVHEVGNVMSTLTMEYPFKIDLIVPYDKIEKSEFKLTYDKEALKIIDLNNNIEYDFPNFSTSSIKHDLPFEINNFDQEKWIEFGQEFYTIYFYELNTAISQLKKDIVIKSVGQTSEILSLSHSSTYPRYSETILNNLINVFNNDGISDRQLVHKRTIDFVNSRYAFLSKELDSIEYKKEVFKIKNNFIDIDVNGSNSLRLSSLSDEEVFKNENQIGITKLLIESLNDKFELLPVNLGLSNPEINVQIENYNKNLIKKNKFVLSAGVQNPLIIELDFIIENLYKNINLSLNKHLNQLTELQKKLKLKNNKFDKQLSFLPQQEKFLREIERNQAIKESLYLFLVQKREEAEISYAVTKPSIKIVESAYTDLRPIYPNHLIVYLLSVVMAILIPFLYLFFYFMLDNKIYVKKDLIDLNLNIPVIGETPLISSDITSEKFVKDVTDRSPLAESMRLICSNLNYCFPNSQDKESKTIMVTSSIKAEGKTFLSINLAIILSLLNKKVLLVGADLYNPRIHEFLGVKKELNGLSKFLADNKTKWKNDVIKYNNHLDILLGGAVPPNPAQLISNNNLEIFVNQAKKSYDYVLLDTPPSILVSDTLNISPLTDLTLFVTRSNYTEKSVLDHVKNLAIDKKIDNLALVLNGVDHKLNKYKYQYGYNYSYNYGYGYGYGEDPDES